MGPAFGELPLLTSAGTYEDLVYVEVSVLRLAIAHVAGETVTLSWSSVAGVTNYIEYTDRWPVQWKVLAAPVGTGERLTVQDEPPTHSNRFYRVRIAY